MSDYYKIIFPFESMKQLLPDISYDKFVDYMFKEGTSDMEYYSYLHKNNMIELSELNRETMSEIILEVYDDFHERTLRFKCIYDSDNEVG